MPRKSQSSQNANTQGISRKRQRDQTLSQTTLEQSFSRSQRALENLDELVNNCVRYIVYRAGSNLPIRKPDLQKHVLHNVGRSFDQVLAKVTEILKNVYGYDLYESDEQTSIKQYLVSNVLLYKAEIGNGEINDHENAPSENIDENQPSSDVNKILIMLVLTHIFMSNNNVSEASLFSFLRSVQIDPDEKHELFGNVKDFVTSTMVKQKYLSVVVEQLTRRVSYLWGSRAEHEISKHALLKFVCKIYKDRKPKSWTSQFESANAQAREEDETITSNGVQVGEEESQEESD